MSPSRVESEPSFLKPGLVLFLLALAVRLIYIRELGASALGMHLLGDGVGYDAWARRIVGGDWFGREVFYQAPFYPYVLALIYGTLGTGLAGVRVIQAIAGATGCVLVAMAGRRFFGRREGIAAGVLLALYPPAIFFDGEIQKASFDLLFSGALLLLLARLRDRATIATSILAGITVALFALNRENALLLVPVIACWLLKQWRLAAVFLAASLLTLLPVALRNQAIGGKLLLTTSQLGPNLYIGNHHGASGRYEPLRPGRGSARYEQEDARALAQEALGKALTPAEVSRYWTGRALAFVRDEPGAWAALLARKWMLLWNQREIVDTSSIEAAADNSLLLRLLLRVYHFGVLLPLAAAGIWLTRRKWRELNVLYLVLGAWAVAITAFFVLARYRYPMVPILALFAGAAIFEIAGMIRQRDLRGRSGAAIVIFCTAIFANLPVGDSRDPRAVTYASLGNAMAENGDPSGGAEMLAWAVAASPDFAEAYLSLGHVRMQLGELDAARASYRRAVELDPTLAAAWNNLGLIAAREGNTAEAEAMFRRAIQENGRHAEALHNLARLRFQAGDHEEASALYERLVRLDPGDAEAHHQLGNLYAFRGDLATARSHYERAVALDDSLSDAHFKLSVILDRAGESAASARQLARAIAITPQYAQRQLQLAMEAERVGRVADANHLYRQLLLAVPNQPDAIRRLASISSSPR
jgi:tetratricopeptide (TPR) repeat protein